MDLSTVQTFSLFNLSGVDWSLVRDLNPHLDTSRRILALVHTIVDWTKSSIVPLEDNVNMALKAVGIERGGSSSEEIFRMVYACLAFEGTFLDEIPPVDVLPMKEGLSLLLFKFCRSFLLHPDSDPLLPRSLDPKVILQALQTRGCVEGLREDAIESFLPSFIDLLVRNNLACIDGGEVLWKKMGFCTMERRLPNDEIIITLYQLSPPARLLCPLSSQLLVDPVCLKTPFPTPCFARSTIEDLVYRSDPRRDEFVLPGGIYGCEFSVRKSLLEQSLNAHSPSPITSDLARRAQGWLRMNPPVVVVEFNSKGWIVK